MIDIDDLEVRSEAGRPILEGVRLQVPRGGVCALVGESGSGKTTLALTLLGRTRAGLSRTTGHVRVAGKDPFALGRAALRAFRRDEIAWVGQDPALSLTP
ncbi:hypothetical protein C0Z11_06875 [Acidipropionibacterium jensenii]|nr:hypothetical protein C0Z11_06875 [Acidipropionibacterium jensenii]